MRIAPAPPSPVRKGCALTQVESEETVWIPLSDGCRLAARTWRPAGVTEPLPAILEFIPYRRRDRHRNDDAFTHPALAARGYVCVRVDMRGSGDSDGLLYDEYTAPEWKDACEVIAWMAEQDWCDGQVGMMGLSWGGFNSLQVAACRPPALKAVVSVCASDDRYRDDMHYMGGCLLNDNLQYGATLFTWLGTPPDPEIVGPRWRQMWLDRLAVVEPPAARWMQHPTRDAYWRSGSVCEDYGQIEVPVLTVSGWADGYTNAVMRLLSGLKGPRKGLIGPWGHAYPHVATPGPSIDFIAYLARWFDHWLKGRDTGLMDEPMLTAWIQQSEPPRPAYVERRGDWIGQRQWPPADAKRLALVAAPGGVLATHPVSGQGTLATISSPADTGTASGEWCPYGWGSDMPFDQRGDDALSATFDMAVLSETLTLLGGSEVELSLDCNRPEGMIAVRLNEVAPDGSSRRITYGLANLALSDDYSGPRRMVPGAPFAVILRLNDAGYEIPAGHSLRLSIATTYWPLAVGSPGPATVRLHSARLLLPLLDADNAAAPPALGTAVVPAYPEARQAVAPARGRIAVTRQLEREETSVEVVRNLGAVELGDVALTLRALGSESYRMPWRDPASALSETSRLAAMQRPDWNVRIESRTSLGFEGEDYRFRAVLEAFEDEAPIFRREWDMAIPRPKALPPGNGPDDRVATLPA
ncbi:CocE/NonD family hydrolase [Microbaculum sp. FT89]|uniref:CocE/NonD family hydrolase n=1 Tax=Microbaculum sp. FT89 TaxID=3447298 RepID=UPI003F538EC6